MQQILSQRNKQHLPPISNSNRQSPRSNKNPQKIEIGKYIQQSLRRIQSGCIKDGKLNIDDSIGDYKMSIFRLKDRNRRINQIPTIFTNTFINRVEKMEPQEKTIKILKISNEEFIKKTAEQSRAKTGNFDSTYIKPKWQSDDGQHLHYQYLPNYQKQKWFSNKTIGSNEYIPPPVQMPQNQPKKLQKKNSRKNDKTHFFRFLDKSYLSGNHSFKNN